MLYKKSLKVSSKEEWIEKIRQIIPEIYDCVFSWPNVESFLSIDFADNPYDGMWHFVKENGYKFKPMGEFAEVVNKDIFPAVIFLMVSDADDLEDYIWVYDVVSMPDGNLVAQLADKEND